MQSSILCKTDKKAELAEPRKNLLPSTSRTETTLNSSVTETSIPDCINSYNVRQAYAVNTVTENATMRKH